MKKIIYVAIISLGVLFASCDYVSNPYPLKNANLGDTASCPVATFPAVTSHIKKILIEDFTGHTCANCPKAATKLFKLDTMYPGRIIGIAEHVGSFATPAPGFSGSPSYAYLDDYSTLVGNYYNTIFTPYAIGLPQGMINRKDFSSANLTHLKFYLTQWEPFVANIISEPSVVDLQLNINYDAGTRKVCCAVRDSFLTSRTDTLNLVVLLTQDSIISWQDNISFNDSSYVFNHVLRDAITPSGAQGESLTTGTIANGFTHISHFAYTIPADYNNVACLPKNCHIIAFIYKTSTKEIIQSEEAKVIP